MSRQRKVSGRVTAAVVILSLAVAAGVVVTSPIFRIREIRVRGAHSLGADQVIRMSGIEEGDNLLLARLGEAEHHLRRSPWVAAASLERSLPATLTITIQERTPVGEIAGRGRGSALVAADGIVVAMGTGNDPALVDLEGVDLRGLEVGDRVRGVDPVLVVAGSFDRRVGRLVASLRLDAGELTGAISGGGELRYGRAELMPQKNAALLNIVRFARREGLAIEYVDVSTPTSPVLKPVGEQTAEVPADPAP